jgi:hypothetical protein
MTAGTRFTPTAWVVWGRDGQAGYFGVNDKGAMTMSFKAGSRSRRCAACGRRGNSRSRSPVAQTLGAGSLGALAVGALALGSGAIGALAIGRLAIKRGAIGRLRVEELSVGRLTVEELAIEHRDGSSSGEVRAS